MRRAVAGFLQASTKGELVERPEDLEPAESERIEMFKGRLVNKLLHVMAVCAVTRATRPMRLIPPRSRGGCYAKPTVRFLI